MVSVTNIFYFIWSFFFSFLISFLKLLILFLIFTLLIATVTLIERKIMSLVQRRVGPNYIGYRGRLQFIADALKMLLKHIAVVNITNRLLFITLPAFVLIISYLFWANIVWMPSLAIFEIEYNVLLLCIVSTGFTYLGILTGYVSNNKYATLSSTRLVTMGICLELLLTFLMLILGCMSETLSFTIIVENQKNVYWQYLLYLPLLPLLLITFFLEVGRTPFDLAEAESELIAGYTTEFGGFYFALFYLAEYFHLFCLSCIYTTFFWGGWNIKWDK